MTPGVLYLSRVPPGMTPGLLRDLLQNTGEIDRLYLRPEPYSRRKARKKIGGSYKPCFLDGWIEYTDKKDAKRAVALLNTQSMGNGRKGGKFRGDLWNLKYLRGFQWEDLTGPGVFARRMRVKRIKGEVAKAGMDKAKWENRISTAEKMEGMRRKRGEKWEVSEDHKGVEFVQNERVADDEDRFGGVDEGDEEFGEVEDLALVMRKRRRKEKVEEG